jgi:anti-sigma factor RsiW
MTDALPQPCARWAAQLSVPSDALAPAERSALEAHVATCSACAAVRADFQRMDARIRSLPNPPIPPGLPRWLQEARAAKRPRAGIQSAITSLSSLENHHMQTNKAVNTPLPAPSGQERPTRRRMVSWVGAAAALVVIAIITAALLISHSGVPTGITGQTPNTNSHRWNTVAGLKDVSAQPVLAPSNPQVIYLVETTKPVSVKRSTDGGAHWKTLSLPANNAAEAEGASLSVSQVNPQNVFLQLNLPDSSSACSSTQASKGQINAYSGGNNCSRAYYSTDGGAHWGVMLCATCGNQVSGSMIPAPVGTIIAQGRYLYSIITISQSGEGGPFAVRYLIESADGGATWQYADSALSGQGMGICSVAAPPTSSSIYALVQTGFCSQPVGAPIQTQAQSHFSIWKSADAGAHWTQVHAFPYQQPDVVASFSAVDIGGAHLALFIGVGQGDSSKSLVSVDEGLSWQTVPDAGLPTNALEMAAASTALSDGAIPEAFQIAAGNGVSFYAWKPGVASWHQIAQPLNQYLFSLSVSSAGGHDTLWAVTTTSKGDYSVMFYTLL